MSANIDDLDAAFGGSTGAATRGFAGAKAPSWKVPIFDFPPLDEVNTQYKPRELNLIGPAASEALFPREASRRFLDTFAMMNVDECEDGDEEQEEEEHSGDDVFVGTGKSPFTTTIEFNRPEGVYKSNRVFVKTLSDEGMVSTLREIVGSMSDSAPEKERLARLLRKVESSPNPRDRRYVEEYIDILDEMSERTFRETGSFDDFLGIRPF